MSEYEKRFTADALAMIEDTTTNTVKVSGYAAVFDQEAVIGGLYRETFKRGAFSEAIKEDDIVFVINHVGLPLARTRSGTLKLSEDDYGLKMEAELELSDPDVQSIVPKMRRGDLDKMSFAFLPTVDEWDERGEMPLRTVSKSRLADVSIVTTPAYDGTDIGLRSLEKFREEKEKTVIKNSRSASHIRRSMQLKLSTVR